MVKRFVNIHSHCIVSNLTRSSKMLTLSPPWKISADAHVHGLGWTNDWDRRNSAMTVCCSARLCFTLVLTSHVTYFQGVTNFERHTVEQLHKTCGDALHKTLKWLVTCIQNKRKLPNLTLYNPSQIIEKVVLSIFQTNEVLPYLKFAWFVTTWNEWGLCRSTSVVMTALL